jgi:GNAT superfamily N-acetyltransferase
MKGYLFWLGLPAGVLAKDGYDNPRLYSGDVIRFRLLLFNKLLEFMENKMINIKYREGGLTVKEQNVVQSGFDDHSNKSSAPAYEKKELCWLGHNDHGSVVAVLTAELLWDWLYIDELWVDESLRGQGFGRQLMDEVEKFAYAEKVSGIWLWTQSWQAEGFYRNLEYQEFVRFPNFPQGHSRIGFRKFVCGSQG